MRTILLFVLFFGMFPLVLKAQNIRRYSRYLEDHKYEKLEEKLQKSLGKDSINAASNYVYSLLYSRTDFPRRDIETAYSYILEAQEDYQLTEGRDLRKLNRWDITPDTLQHQRHRLDSLAFERALRENTEATYQRFLDKHPRARQTTEAIERRNELGYAKAQESNTYQSYKAFAEKYPEARQVKEAKGLYHFLLFEERTQDKDREAYDRFLKEYPNNPYISEAQKQLFEIITAPNTRQAYEVFLETYPQSPYRAKAVSMLYHFYLQEYSADDFRANYPDLLTDSLRRSIRMADDLLIPVLQDSLYGFMDSAGKIIFAPSFTKISPDYRCQGVTQDYFVAGDTADPYIIAKNGSLIYSEPFHELKDFGYGLLKVRQNALLGLIHKAGYSVLNVEYDNLELLVDSYIAYEKRGKWGVKTLSGRTVFKAAYDSIYQEGDFIVLKQEDKLALTNKDQLTAAVENLPVYLAFMYEDAEEYQEKYIVAYREEQQTLLNLNLTPVIPMGNHEIYEWYGGWLLENQGKYKVYDSGMKAVTEDSIEKVEYNKNWLALKNDQRWTLLNRIDSSGVFQTSDSLRLLSDDFVIFFQGDTIQALFNGGKSADISKQQMIRLLTVFDENTLKQENYLMVSYARNRRQVYNPAGEIIIEGRYEEVVPAGNQLLIVKNKKQEGLFTAAGDELLPARYDGVGKYREGLITVLDGGKFGLFDLQKKVLIKPQFDAHLERYNDSLYVASKNRRRGLVDSLGKAVTIYAFEKVLYWTDSLALVQEDGEWGLFDIYNDDYAYEAIEELEVIRSEQDEVVIKVLRDEKYGILSSTQGELVPAAYDLVENIGNAEVPAFFARIYIKEADFYVGIYYNAAGEIIRRQAFTLQEFERISCPQQNL